MATGQIVIAAVGKLRHREWRSMQNDYLKRLRRYTGINLVEVKDSVGKGFPDQVAMTREGEQLLQATSDVQRRVLLTPNGQEMSSEAFAEFIQKQIETFGRIGFLVGGPLGFSEEVIFGADTALALSQLTFPHELARIILLEQLYRAFTILRGESYHK
ncbi:MAG: 23S rRNA (pseudouridine(1915)-N(3))-methyltransferase RlmH [Candidatus Promineifilaceae bacterium]|nr:23S rRNA (pseudouridine(1915)-N(3))-methyltransferase RlmH [Candidatus Promineifilaceae bacterium]